MKPTKQIEIMISKNELIHILAEMEKIKPFGKNQDTFKVMGHVQVCDYNDGTEEEFITILHPIDIEKY